MGWMGGRTGSSMGFKDNSGRRGKSQGTEGGDRGGGETVGGGSDLYESTGEEAAGENYGSTKEKDSKNESVGIYRRILSVGYDDQGLTIPFRTRSRNVFIINFVRVSGVTGSPCVVHQVSNASTSTSTLMGRIPCA